MMKMKLLLPRQGNPSPHAPKPREHHDLGRFSKTTVTMTTSSRAILMRSFFRCHSTKLKGRMSREGSGEGEGHGEGWREWKRGGKGDSMRKMRRAKGSHVDSDSDDDDDL